MNRRFLPLLLLSASLSFSALSDQNKREDREPEAATGFSQRFRAQVLAPSPRTQAHVIAIGSDHRSQPQVQATKPNHDFRWKKSSSCISLQSAAQNPVFHAEID